MKKWIKFVALFAILAILCFSLTACTGWEASATKNDVDATLDIGSDLAQKQPTPTDIGYSLERYNLIRRTYWVNGMRDKAMAVPCPITEIPLGYVILFTESGDIVGRFTVDGKVTSLNSYLTPDSEYYEQSRGDYSFENEWLPDVDGSYGENDNGIFFFTTDGKYIEWTGTYLYSDIPFTVESSILGSVG